MSSNKKTNSPFKKKNGQRGGGRVAYDQGLIPFTKVRARACRGPQASVSRIPLPNPFTQVKPVPQGTRNLERKVGHFPSSFVSSAFDFTTRMDVGAPTLIC